MVTSHLVGLICSSRIMAGNGERRSFRDYFPFMDIEVYNPFRAAGECATSNLSMNQSSSGEEPESSQCDMISIDDDLQTADVSELEEAKECLVGGDEYNVDDDDQMGVGLHPLLFPDVIKDVLKHLPANEVESARLVCKVWNVEACKVLQSKRVVVLLDSDAVAVYNKAMQNTTDFPHAQYELCMPDYTDGLDENLRVFWSTFGHHVKSLEFRQNQVYWRDLLQVVVDKTPNLERLAFRHLPRHSLRHAQAPAERPALSNVKELRLASLPSSSGIATERLTDLLKVLPNLEVISFLRIKAPLLQSRVSRLMVDILQHSEVNLPNLSRLDLSLQLSAEGVEGLATKRFKFQQLDLSLSNGVKASAFRDLLFSLRSSLTELTIGFPETFASFHSFMKQNGGVSPEESVQVLNNLKSLKMSNFKGSINFLLKLPQLSHLEFTTSNMEKVIPFGFKTYAGSFDHNLQSLSISPVGGEENVPTAETMTIESISRCFPNLTRLKLNDIDDDGLGVIYRNLPFLSEVEFLKATCSDQGLTGIPLEICSDMVETCTFIVVQAERYRRDLFIGSLQFLRKFSIVSPNISDASIALGLVDCKNLQELKIGSPKISDTGIIFVTDKFHKQLHCLDVTECTEITEQSKFYAREKLVGELKVADSPSDQPIQSKPNTNEPVCDPNRGIVKTKKSAPVSYLSQPPLHSKFIVPDTNFFEEHSEADIRDRAFVGLDQPDPNNRLRVLRIREALRRNRDLMQNLQRMGIQQFRRLIGRELDMNPDEHDDNMIDGVEQRIRAVFRRRRAEVRYFPANINNDAIPRAELRALDGGDPPGPPPFILFEDDDGGPIAGAGMDDGAHEHFPEIHLAEIFRLGLRVEDVEFWLQHRALFERDEAIQNPMDVPMLRHLRAGFLLAGMNWREAENNGNVGVQANIEGADDDNDMEAIRRMVMNAFAEDDLPFEG